MKKNVVMSMGFWLSIMLSFPVLALTDPGENGSPSALLEQHAHKVDTDGDGKVSLEEFKAARLKHVEQQFNQMDINHDGYIDDVEKNMAVEKLKAQIRQLREQRAKPKTPSTPTP